MTIQFSKNAPDDAHRRIQQHLSQASNLAPRFKTDRSADRSAIGDGGDEGGSVKISEGLEIWAIHLEKLQNDAFSSVEASNWNYLIFANNKVIAEAHLRKAASASPVTAIHQGPTTTGIVRALAVAETHPKVKEYDFEPRILHIPSVTFNALWLHSEQTDDIVIPFPPSVLSLEHFKPFSLQETQIALQAAARDLYKQMEAAPGPSAGGGGKSHAAFPHEGDVPAVIRLWGLDLMPNPDEERNRMAAGGGAAVLSQFMQPQKQSNWCWSAVGTSVGLFFQTGDWKQCSTATACLSLRGMSGLDCCNDPTTCNVYGYLNDSLNHTKSLASWQAGTASLNQIQSEINAEHPVCVRVAWSLGGAHFMAITGYNDGTISIQDSIYGTSSMLYSDYPASYHSGGTWTHTYYCKPNSTFSAEN